VAAINHANTAAAGGVIRATIWNADHNLTGTANNFLKLDGDGELDEASFAEVALTDGATITPDFSTGYNFSVTLGGSRTLANPTNAVSGQAGTIFVTQDGTGSRALTYGSNWKFPGGSGALSTGAGDVDAISYYVRSNGTIVCCIIRDFTSP
jgi:hypothetical protein